MTFALRPFPLAAATLSLLLSACASPPRTAAQDSQIKSAAVVPLLSESPRVVRTGVTVFGNGFIQVEQDGAMNRTAIEVIEKRLKTSRPNWAIRQAMADPADLLQKARARGASWNGMVGNLKEELKQIAERTDADVLFVAFEYGSDLAVGGVGTLGGLGTLYRCNFFSKPDGPATVHSFISLILVDRSGTPITGEKGGSERFAVTDIKPPCDFAQLQASPVAQQLSREMQKQLAVSLEGAASSMGY